MNLLIDVVKHRWRDRSDFFVGGNMFIYYSVQQVRNRDYKGPDFFVVKHIDGRSTRQKWVVWEEHGRYPNLIIELMSPATAQADLGSKKDLYEHVFHTEDYFCYDPDTQQLYGWRLGENGYAALEPDGYGRLWSNQLEAWLGIWDGDYLHTSDTWLRLFANDGTLIPTEAEDARQEAEAARRRAAAAEAELDQLRATLARPHEEDPDSNE
jgi:Uma2 family endonuclease